MMKSDSMQMDDPEEFELYRLDYEDKVFAAGGEDLQPGDHVYMWCTLYQHHGIVLSTSPSSKNQQSGVWIAEFTNVALFEANTFLASSSTASGAVSGTGVKGGFRFLWDDEPQKWHKVKYEANPIESVTWRPGTCSASKPSKPEIILQRVQFLHDCRHLIPKYHLIASNCETVAVWCVTGKWETLQYQQTMKWSQVALAGSVALMMPGVGVAATGLALWHSQHMNKQWQETAEKLDKEFQWFTMGKRPLSSERWWEKSHLDHNK